jgi:ZIP family zinc transporter
LTPLLLACSTVVSTALGGVCALHYRERLRLLMGFAAGVLLGVVSFHLLPEIIAQINARGYESMPIMVALVAGFLVFHSLEKALVIHHSHEHQYAEHHHPDVGVLSALALVAHSFMDGVGIGLGFRVSRAVGIVVAVAVISHDFTDGMNSVTIMLAHRNTTRRAIFLLLLDAVAPLLGFAATYFFSMPRHLLVLYLGFLAGFLLYIGASDILPEAHSGESSPWTIVMTVLGALLTYALGKVV